MAGGILRTTADLDAARAAGSQWAAGGGVGLARALLAAPAQLYLTGGEHLQLTSVAAYSPLPVVFLNGRLLRASDNEVVPFSFRHDVAPADTPGVQRFAMDEGALLNVGVFPESTGFEGQLAFVRVQIILGLDGAITTLGTLVQGYVAMGQDLAWPGTPLQRIDEGPGIAVPFADWQPSIANTVQSVTVPPNQCWEVGACEWTITTSAVVANRNAVVTILKDGQQTWRVEHPFNIVAAGGATVSAGEGIVRNETSTYGILQLPLPSRVRLEAGTQIQLQLVNAQAGDVIAGQQILARAWLEY